jgi:uncharacterized membrane protein
METEPIHQIHAKLPKKRNANKLGLIGAVVGGLWGMFLGAVVGLSYLSFGLMFLGGLLGAVAAVTVVCGLHFVQRTWLRVLLGLASVIVSLAIALFLIVRSGVGT